MTNTVPKQGDKDEKVCTLFALRSLIVRQILSSIMVTRDMLGMLLDGAEALNSLWNQTGLSKSRMVWTQSKGTNRS